MTIRLVDEWKLDPRQANLALGALRRVAQADGAVREAGERLLATAATALDLGDWRSVDPANADDVAAAFPEPAARRVLVDVSIVAAAIEGEVTLAGEREVSTLARALAVRSPWVDVLPALRRRNVFAVKRSLMRRSPDARRLFARTWEEEGPLGFFRAALFVAGLHRDQRLAARFRALAALPKGSFGRTFFDDLNGKGLAFPGERGGIPERMIHHDLMHVVNGYGTDAAGECELAGFYAGFTEGEPFTFIVIVLATFQLGMSVSPAAVTPTKLAFDPPRVLAAFLRGRRLRVDVMGRWDYWTLMPLPIDQVRRELGIAEAES